MTLIYSPFPSLDAARTAASALLHEKLVACCNIIPSVESHYWWEGKLTQSTEVILLCKTTIGQSSALTARLEALHPYDCPAILTLDVAANPLFAKWVEESVNL